MHQVYCQVYCLVEIPLHQVSAIVHLFQNGSRAPPERLVQAGVSTPKKQVLKGNAYI